MYQLSTQIYNGVEVVDSREVADMVERDHAELLKTIRIYVGYLREGEVTDTDFFIESTYLSKQNHPLPNYLITKKGCDMVANKMIGAKGVIFTAAYVTAFEKMHTALTAPVTPAQLALQQAQILVDMERKLTALESQATALTAQNAAVQTQLDTLTRNNHKFEKRCYGEEFYLSFLRISTDWS